MDQLRIPYKGCVIRPMPMPESEGWYYGGYEISKDGKVIRTRQNVFPGSYYHNAAVAQSIEHAKLEVDNLVGVKRISINT